MSEPLARPPSHLFYQTRQRRPMLDRGEGVYLYDTDGKAYLDGSSGAMVANIGHSNPNVLEAMRRQMEKATFGYRLHFENEPAEKLAARTAQYMPDGLDRVFFVSGGSEAVESCIKLARQYTIAVGEPQRWKVISRFPSYHGSTLGALSLTGMATMSAPFAPMMREMQKIPAPTCYLDRDDLSDDERGLRYANMLRDRILQEGPETVLAFIVEPIGGASTGALVAPDNYLPRIREICDEFGILLIYDEVMTGAGADGQVPGGRSLARRQAGYRRAVERLRGGLCAAGGDGRGPQAGRTGPGRGRLHPRLYLCRKPAGLRGRSGGAGRDRTAGARPQRGSHGRQIEGGP